MVCALLPWRCFADTDTMTGSFRDDIKTLQVGVEGVPLAPPVITLNGNDRIIISFDHIADDRCYLRYELIHCNADWQPSRLVDSEFLDGFNQGDIDVYDFSQLTSVHYVHYSLTIPNEQVAPKISGNYLLRIYPEDDPDDTWAQCRFMVTEQCAAIDARLSSQTDVDFNSEHQQLSLAIDTERANVQDPFNDVIVKIQQNGRWDNEASLRQPLRMASRSVSVYEHLRPLIFEAGNEYRRMETVSVSVPGMRVADIAYSEPYYHMALLTDEPRSKDMYLYDRTQHGAFTIREYNSDLSDIEADYVVVHFTLDMDEMPDAMVFLDGDFTNRRFDPEALMTYNRATRRYERNMLLKQGAYNYQYLVVPRGSSVGSAARVEGNKFQTSNQYLVKVYERRPGARYDRLIATSLVEM